MNSINAILTPIFKNLGMEDRIKLEFMRNQWRSLFNEPLSLHTYPVEIKDGELLINVNSPVWLQQLKFFKQDIMKKLHLYNIKHIRFRHGKVYHKEAQRGAEQLPQSKPLSDHEITWINQTTSAISDAELKEGAKKAITKSLSNPLQGAVVRGQKEHRGQLSGGS